LGSCFLEDRALTRVLMMLVACVFTTSVVAQTATTKPTTAAQKRTTVTKAVASVKKQPVKTLAKPAVRSNKNLRPVKARILPDPEPVNPAVLEVQSTAALVISQDDGSLLYSKNTAAVAPIASITKLMTAMVVLDSKLPLDEVIPVTDDDIDHVKNTGSRVRIGSSYTRDEMLRMALMASENRAASALGRAYPGGLQAFVREMNLKAIALDMMQTSFVDSTGLSSSNVSSAHDLAKMVNAAFQYPQIRQYSTGTAYAVHTPTGRTLEFHNTNQLVPNPDWQIGLSKTGYIREAGRCLVMQATIAAQPVIIVLLDSWGRLSRAGDANRIKRWMEYKAAHTIAG